MDGTKSLVAQFKKEDVLAKSSSGGVFYYIASHFIQSDGVVYGAAVNNMDGFVYHTRATSLKELEPIMSSKYVESTLEGTYESVKNDLLGKKKVLFTGTPCQVAIIYSKLIKDDINMDNILLVDLICHGVPDKKYWSHYLKSISRSPYNINFRNKEDGWNNFSITINDYKNYPNRDIYMYLFLNNYTLLEKCYSCPFKGENRFSDITLGDAWGIESYMPAFNHNNKGASLVLIRNNKCNIENIIEELHPFPVDYIKATYYSNPLYFNAASKPKDKEIVIKQFLNNEYIIPDSNSKSTPKRIVTIMKSIINNYLSNKIGIEKNLNKKLDIGIITLDGYYNFGNKLQNFALHTILRRNGYKTINIERHGSTRPFEIIKHRNLRKKEYLIYKVAKKYEGKHLLSSTTNYNNIHTILVGSDQVWNYNLPQFLPETLCFNFNHSNIHSYAASFSFEKMNKKYSQIYKESLSKFKNISIREKIGLGIVNELGLDGSFDLDPTLLIEKEVYDLYIKKYSKVNLPKEEYVLRYIIGGDKVPNMDNCKTVDLSSPKDKYYNINHFDFIYLIKNAKYVITNSFHGTVFSMIFGKTIHLYKTRENKSMKSRFDIFFELFSTYTENDDFIVLNGKDVDYNKYKVLKDKSINNLLKVVGD